MSLTPETNDCVAGQISGVHEVTADSVRSPAQEVPHHRVSTLRCNNNAHPTEVGWASINDDKRHNLLATPPDYLPKISCGNDPIEALEHYARLDRYFAATLAAPSGQDSAAGAGTHAQAESVHLGAATVVGLISTLGHCVLLGEWPEQSGDDLCSKAQPQKNRAGIEASQTVLSLLHTAGVHNPPFVFVANMVTYPQAHNGQGAGDELSRRPLAPGCQ